jgi:hypothetical protein
MGLWAFFSFGLTRTKLYPTKKRTATRTATAVLTEWRIASHIKQPTRCNRAPKAITAAAHKLARIIYHMLKTGERYDDLS